VPGRIIATFPSDVEITTPHWRKHIPMSAGARDDRGCVAGWRRTILRGHSVGACGTRPEQAGRDRTLTGVYRVAGMIYRRRGERPFAPTMDGYRICARSNCYSFTRDDNGMAWRDYHAGREIATPHWRKYIPMSAGARDDRGCVAGWRRIIL
jgi:hypothetical protein